MTEYVLDESTYVRNYVVLEKRNKISIRKRVLLFTFSGGLIVGMAVIGQYVASVMLAGITTVFTWFWIKGPEWTARRNYRMSSILKNPIRVRIDEDGIYYLTIQGEGMLKRDGFFRIEETDEVLFVQHNNGIHLFIPVNRLSPREAELIRMMRTV